MIKLIQNEFIKILKRRNIYILICFIILIMLGYNFYGKYTNTNELNIHEQYKKAYHQDQLYLETYDSLDTKEKYTDILERVKLEKYAIDHNISSNLLVNTENKNVLLPLDARIAFMRVFNNFDMLVIIFVLYITSTIICEEYSKGTIKTLLVKPHKKSSILLAKMLTCFFMTVLIFLFVLIFQYIIGGLLFGFESYSLESLRYNHLSDQINHMPLINYMGIMFVAKMPLYVVISLISLLLGVMTNNIAINILISFATYSLFTTDLWVNSIAEKCPISNLDLSQHLFGGMAQASAEAISLLVIMLSAIIMVLLILVIHLFNQKEVMN